jgi:hypothetical protein
MHQISVYPGSEFDRRTYRPLVRRDIDRIPQLRALGPEELVALKAVSAVFPFRVNQYVVERLIDWSQVPEDPIYQLTFPQRGMLEPDEFATMVDLVRRDAPRAELVAAAREIQLSKNPHPAGQAVLNVPSDDLGKRSAVAGNHRRPTGHRLHGGQPESLEEGGQHERQ